ncbi:DEAD/DEAH box helicase [Sulfobacillus harzensis]|uniref:DEAD/DEAH box helicase n=1 Tax=Sulfobacillus harzensis TaxID=2729629 RepID=A0A7Y0Q2R9_9FIRM|nr:DEAD/DEAH box helicase [Sulfobacillus harzensis]NMP23463.1 DEAD/DEAH box helicase [Sulfobacillus harzensis]
MTVMAISQQDWPVLVNGQWGFTIDGRFVDRDRAVALALTTLQPQYRSVFVWWDFFLDRMLEADVLPALEPLSQGVVPVWRLVDAEAVVRAHLEDSEKPLTDDQVRYLASFLNDWVDAFVRRHAPDLEARRAIGGPLGRRLVARLMRPRAVWDVNASDRRLLAQVSQEWQTIAAELGLRGGPDTPVIRLESIEGGRLTLQVSHAADRDVSDWALRFPAWRRLTVHGRDALLALDDRESDAFWQEELPALIAEGVKVEMPGQWRNPRLHIRGQLQHSDEPRASRLGLDQIVEVDWEVLLGDHPMTLSELEGLVRASRPLIRLGGQFVVLDDDTLQEARRMYERAKRSRVKMADALRWAVGGVDEGVEVVSSGEVYRMLSQLTGPYPPFEPLAGFRGDLRQYQQEGVEWLVRRMKSSVGALLADDMGLGKTVEVIAALTRLKQDGAYLGPVLIAAPLSVVGNWEREFARFNPRLKVGSHLGTTRLEGPALIEWVGEFDAVLTTYDVLLRDVDWLKQVDWLGVVADEAQQIKNPNTKRARAIRRIPARWRVALTGTPVENRLKDLWAEMEFLNPGYLGSEREFRQRFERSERSLGDLRRLLAPFVLRRMKTDPNVMPDLPDKVEIPEWTHLTPEQIGLYQAVVDTLFREVDGSMTRMARRGAIVAALTHLKQIVDHPALYLHQSGPMRGRSGKLERLEELLAEILEASERVVIFSQYVAWVQLLAPYLRRHFHTPVLTFHGSMGKAERDQVIHDFTDPAGPPILLASLKAGGVGLNLASAQHVIHYDRWWNPATEDQATDRVWRMGQTSLVTVHKFVTRGTVEERIDALIQEKRHLSRQILSESGSDMWVSELSNRELRELVELRQSLTTSPS